MTGIAEGMEDGLTWHDVLGAAELGPGEVVTVEAGVTVAVVNVDGEYFAVDDRCSHAAAPLSEGRLDGGELCCPWHAGRFCVRTGRARCLPARRPIATYPVRVACGRILVGVATPTIPNAVTGIQADRTARDG
jgi:3-phenylpropionate/trans-cinnamate dioxygenase ferredoxin subunit